VLTLRPYQVQALAGVDALIAAGQNRPAVVQATGLGKTVQFSAWLAEQHRLNPRGRSVVMVHRDELAQQARDEIHAYAPHLRPGIVMGSQSDHDRPVVIASVQTIGRRNASGGNRRREQIHSVRRGIVDEAHHAAAPTYRESMEYWGAFSGVPWLGFTATMKRDDKRGLGEIWQQIVERPDGGVWDTEWGVRNGYLVTPRGFRVKVPQLDLSQVRTRAGDLDVHDQATAMLDANTGAAIVKAIRDPELCRCDGTDRGVVFCPDVETAVTWAAEMNEAGIRTGVILGTTPKEERRRLFMAFRLGTIEWLCNAMVLTEGWNAPWCNVLIIARKTKSATLYQQMLGRGLRLFAGKTECRVLDVCGVTDMHGLAGLADLSMDGRVTPKDGQSLLEALEEFDAEQGESPFVSWDVVQQPAPVHRVVGTEIDLFGHSHSAWLQTRRGTWFVPAADLLFFLWPQADGLFGLWWVPKVRAQDAVLIQPDLPLEIGMALAEQHAAGYAPQETGKDAPWRQKGPVRAGQKRDLENLDLKIKRGMTAADAYDAMCVEIASRRLDWAS
jgi:superfamily II DNA or RNA helicase